MTGRHGCTDDGGVTSPTPEQVRAAVALQRLRETYEPLDRWRDRSSELEEPETGSELHGDMAIWPSLPPHQVARLSLISGVQHLNLARAAVEQGQAFPIAHPTVLRGALLGAARGVWLLAPNDRHERQQNALRVIHELHRRLRQYIEDGAAGFVHATQTNALSELDSRLASIKPLWAATPALSQAETPTETKIITSAAGSVFRDADQVAAVPGLWMQLSGDAHGLGWPILTRPSTEMVNSRRLAGYPARMAEFRSGADLFEIVDAFMAAFLMLRRGWSLFDQRSEAP